MTDVIWKAVLEPTDMQDIEVPAGAEFLCAREQHEAPVVWYRCDTECPREKRRILIAGTGHHTPPGRYIGTAFLSGGQLVLHIFDAGAAQ
jgi:hypothetical protein